MPPPPSLLSRSCCRLRLLRSSRAAAVIASARREENDDGEVQEAEAASGDDDNDDAGGEGLEAASTGNSAFARTMYPAPTNDPERPWEADLPTIDQVLENPDWPSLVGNWPRFWALYELWRFHLFQRTLPPLSKEENKNPRARPLALWERALRLAPPDGAEEASIAFAPGVYDDGSGGGGKDDDDDDAAGGAGGGGAQSVGTVNAIKKSIARFEAREAARAAALPPMTSEQRKKYLVEAAGRDEEVFDAVCAVHRALPGLLEARVPVPERLEAADPWGSFETEELGGVDLALRETKNPTVLPTYHTGGVVGGTNTYPGPRSSTGLQRASRMALQQNAAASFSANPALSRSRAEAEEEELARKSSSFANGVVQHEWSTWGDVELRAWNEKRRAHARADAAFAVRQSLVGKHKGYNVDEITDLRMAKRVVGLRNFKLIWTHEEIMDVITNDGQNVHPDLAAPALGVVDPARNLDYWEEGIHAPSDITSELAASGRLADDEAGLRDLSAMFALTEGEGEFEGEFDEDDVGEGGEGGESSDGNDEASPSPSSSSAAAAAAAEAAAAAPMSPFPTAAATSADLAETFEGLDEMTEAAGIGVGGDEEEEDNDVDVEVLDDDLGSDNEIGGIPGIDVDPDDDENGI